MFSANSNVHKYSQFNQDNFRPYLTSANNNSYHNVQANVTFHYNYLAKV